MFLLIDCECTQKKFQISDRVGHLSVWVSTALAVQNNTTTSASVPQPSVTVTSPTAPTIWEAGYANEELTKYMLDAEAKGYTVFRILSTYVSPEGSSPSDL